MTDHNPQARQSSALAKPKWPEYHLPHDAKHREDETVGEKLDRIADLMQAIVSRLPDPNAISDVRRDMAEERSGVMPGRLFYPPYSRAEAEAIHDRGDE